MEKYSSKYRNIVFVKPAISHFIKVSTDEEYVERTIRDSGIRKADWVFIPVNNNETENEGGSHWSLLLYSGNSNTFYHFDPIKGMNDRSVAIIIKKLINNEKKIPEVKYVICPRQRNCYDCGPYTIMFMEKIAENIEAGVEITKIRDFDAKEYRKKLRRKIEEKYNLNEEKLKEEKVSHEKKEENIPNKNKKELNDQKKEERKKECWHYTNKTCKFGNRCRYEHRQKCNEMIENGYCYDQNCRLGHTRICSDIYETGRCKRVMCRYFHPINLRNKNLNNQPSKKFNYEEMNERPKNRQYKPYLQGEVTSTRPQNEYEWYERKREHSVNFLDNQNRNWIDLMEPIMKRAMDALAERMWERYQR